MRRYVIPVPYYDKNPDGSFRKVHYEGDRFPSNVSITHYNDYDLKKGIRKKYIFIIPMMNTIMSQVSIRFSTHRI